MLGHRDSRALFVNDFLIITSSLTQQKPNATPCGTVFHRHPGDMRNQVFSWGGVPMSQGAFHALPAAALALVVEGARWLCRLHQVSQRSRDSVII